MINDGLSEDEVISIMCDVAYSVEDMVKLKNGEWVKLSDKLRIEGVVIETGDTAIVRCFGNKKIVVDVKKNHKETVNGVGDLDTQVRQFNRLQGGY